MSIFGSLYPNKMPFIGIKLRDSSHEHPFDQPLQRIRKASALLDLGELQGAEYVELAANAANLLLKAVGNSPSFRAATEAENFASAMFAVIFAAYFAEELQIDVRSSAMLAVQNVLTPSDYSAFAQDLWECYDDMRLVEADLLRKIEDLCDAWCHRPGNEALRRLKVYYYSVCLNETCPEF